MPTELELRKVEEIDFHNRLRCTSIKADSNEFQRLTANRKYYSVARSSKTFFEQWIIKNCKGKTVLDYGCGDAPFSFLAAANGANVTGIDISDVSIENCKNIAREKGLAEQVNFLVMDCEALQFPSKTFDVIFIAGVLHHLDLRKALSELARVVKPDGKIIAYEALGHNPAINLYRKLTPHLRTEFETNNILKMENLKTAREHFQKVTPRFFHLMVLAAVPFRKWPGFFLLLRFLELGDALLLKIPIVRRYAWMMTFTLEGPIKT